MADVATNKLFESDKIIVWEMVLEPGESTGLHTHELNYFFYVIEGSSIEVEDDNEHSLGEFTLEAGTTIWATLEGVDITFGDKVIPVTHSARNVGSSCYREILIECKQ